MELKIGSVKLKNNIVLAPMAGVCTSSFRNICLEHGAGMVCTEMISDKGLTYENKKTLKMIEVNSDEHPVSMQIFGSDYNSITSACKILLSHSNIDILDVNMGCPVNKVVKTGAGSALLKEPNKVYDIVKSLKDSFDIPVTIKIRAGWDHFSINCDEIAKIASLAGVDGITIHGRTRSDLYNGSSNVEYIKMVKDNASCPVIGNGDIKDIISAKRVFDIGVDGIAIGRGAMGNPFIFNELSTYFDKGIIVEKPTPKTIIETMLDHTLRLIEEKGEHIALIEMRTHAIWYLKQIPNTKQYRNGIVNVKTYNELKAICDTILQNIY